MNMAVNLQVIGCLPLNHHSGRFRSRVRGGGGGGGAEEEFL